MFSTTSALFMFPAMYPYYLKALEVYHFERTDGIGKSFDIVIQGFVRFAFLALFPMIVAVAAIYLLVGDRVSPLLCSLFNLDSPPPHLLPNLGSILFFSPFSYKHTNITGMIILYSLTSPHCTYVQLIDYRSYDILVYLQVLVVNISLNQCWIALLIALICAFPVRAFRLSPVIAAVAGFTSGFFIPVGTLNWG